MSNFLHHIKYKTLNRDQNHFSKLFWFNIKSISLKRSLHFQNNLLINLYQIFLINSLINSSFDINLQVILPP